MRAERDIDTADTVVIPACLHESAATRIKLCNTLETQNLKGAFEH
jgi:hypothetical protein